MGDACASPRCGCELDLDGSVGCGGWRGKISVQDARNWEEALRWIERDGWKRLQLLGVEGKLEHGQHLDRTIAKGWNGRGHPPCCCERDEGWKWNRTCRWLATMLDRFLDPHVASIQGDLLHQKGVMWPNGASLASLFVWARPLSIPES